MEICIYQVTSRFLCLKKREIMQDIGYLPCLWAKERRKKMQSMDLLLLKDSHSIREDIFFYIFFHQKHDIIHWLLLQCWCTCDGCSLLLHKNTTSLVDNGDTWFFLLQCRGLQTWNRSEKLLIMTQDHIPDRKLSNTCVGWSWSCHKATGVGVISTRRKPEEKLTFVTSTVFAYSTALAFLAGGGGNLIGKQFRGEFAEYGVNFFGCPCTWGIEYDSRYVLSHQYWMV